MIPCDVPRYGGYFLATRPRGRHPLYYAVPYHGSFKPEVAEYAIHHYSRPGEVVLDPFCGRGTVSLAAQLLGRVGYACDTSPLAVRVTRAKTRPCDPEAVAAWLDRLPPPRPVALDPRLVPFFHPRTLAELAVLRAALRRDRTRLARWVEFLALVRLHGASIGYLSAPTFDTIALSPAAQRRRLARLGVRPAYRPLRPRLLDAARRLARAPLPPWFTAVATQARTRRGDARCLPFPDRSAQLVVTSPPFLDQIDYAGEQWLRLWLLGYPPEVARRGQADCRTPEAWQAFLAKVFAELARVLVPGGHALFDVHPVRRGGRDVPLPELCLETAARAGWRPCAVYEHRDGGGRRFKQPTDPARQRASHLLVLEWG